MISSERSQTIIVSAVIIISLLSSAILINNSMYYTSSYALAGSMEVSLVSAEVRNIDHTNESLYPTLSFIFNFRTDASTEGNVRLMFVSIVVWLNDDHLSFTDFRRTITNEDDQVLHPGYDNDITLAKTINSETDRNTVLLANTTDSWNWFIQLRYNFITFDESRSLTWRTLFYNWTGAVFS